VICAVCGEGVQRIVAGYGLCSKHATSLSSAITSETYAADEWFRAWKQAYDEGRGLRR